MWFLFQQIMFHLAGLRFDYPPGENKPLNLGFPRIPTSVKCINRRR